VGEFANKIRAIQAWAIRLELFGDVVEKKENFWTLASHCHENCCINFHGKLVPKVFFRQKGQQRNIEVTWGWIILLHMGLKVLLLNDVMTVAMLP